jgi:hypothetical protein
MWIFTGKGFFSIVEHNARPDDLLVRARAEEDINQFLDMLRGCPEDYQYEATPDADYGYRLVAPKREVAEIIGKLTADIDYTNFKASIHGDGIRDVAYMQLWATMKGFQNAKERQKRLEG